MKLINDTKTYRLYLTIKLKTYTDIDLQTIIDEITYHNVRITSKGRTICLHFLDEMILLYPYKLLFRVFKYLKQYNYFWIYYYINKSCVRLADGILTKFEGLSNKNDLNFNISKIYDYTSYSLLYSFIKIYKKQNFNTTFYMHVLNQLVLLI